LILDLFLFQERFVWVFQQNSNLLNQYYAKAIIQDINIWSGSCPVVVPGFL
jgi:hypothetical protein